MKPIELLSQILKILGWLSIIVGFILLIQSVFTLTASLLSIISIIQQFLGGLINLTLARGLAKKEKWAWYISFVIFTLWFLIDITEGFLIKSSITIYFSFIYIIFLGILIKEKKSFIEQPKGILLEWFRNPYFAFVVAGSLVLYFISGVSVYLNFAK